MFKWLEANSPWLATGAGITTLCVLFGFIFAGAAILLWDWLGDRRHYPGPDYSVLPAKPKTNYFDAMDSLCESIADSPSAANLQYTMLVYQLQEAGIEYVTATQAARRLMLEVFECPLPPPPLFPRQEPR